jgi:signal transduction histidine kinase
MNTRAIIVSICALLIDILLFLNVFVEGVLTGIMEKILLLVAFSCIGVYLILVIIRNARKEHEVETLESKVETMHEEFEDKMEYQVSQMKEAYGVQKKSKEELQDLDKAEKEFITSIQKQLRTPLTVIVAVVRSLSMKKEGDQFSKMDMSFLKKASESVEMLNKLIKDLSDVAMYQEQIGALRKRPTSIHPLVDGILEDLAPEIEKKKIEIIRTYSMEAKETTVRMDPRMKQAFQNVLENAVYYTAENGRIEVSGEVDTHPVEETQIYRFIVHDSGIGMTEEERTKLFTRLFERGEKAKEVHGEGKGVGLLQAKQMITSHGGTIRAESGGRDEGATFIIELPV